MKYARLGDSRLEVSRIAIGCMSWGAQAQGRPWTMSEEFAEGTIVAALAAGINFFDTANVYSQGTSEQFTGRALWKNADRGDVVLATKVAGRMRPGPDGAGLSRRAIFREIDASLSRLGTDYIDLYQIHRWDPLVSIEETMEALNDIVLAGKARYLGASSMYAWQFAKAQHVAEANGWTKFVTMQNHYNLIYREEEREMIPLCRDQGVSLIPWSPLARGRLARPWNARTSRSETDEYAEQLYRDDDADVVGRVLELAEQLGVTQAEVALAWLLAQPGVASPIVGVTRFEHLANAISALDLALTDDQVSWLGENYLPHRIAGHN